MSYCGKTIVVNLENSISLKTFEELAQNAKNADVASYQTQLLEVYFSNIIGSNYSCDDKLPAFAIVKKYESYPSIKAVLEKTRKEHALTVELLEYLYLKKWGSSF